jgi:hypothetical protein
MHGVRQVKANDEMLHAAKTAFELERNAGAWFLHALRAAIDAAIVDAPDVTELLSARERVAVDQLRCAALGARLSGLGYASLGSDTADIIIAVLDRIYPKERSTPTGASSVTR